MNDEYNKFFIEFGQAIVCAQRFEFNLGSLLLAIDRINKREITVENLFDLDKKYSRFTLGRLLAELRTKVTVGESLEPNLTEALEKRNYLIHRFYTEDAEYLIGEHNVDKMVSKIQEIHRILTEADLDVQGLLSVLQRASGITQEQIDEEHRNLIAKHRASST